MYYGSAPLHLPLHPGTCTTDTAFFNFLLRKNELFSDSHRKMNILFNEYLTLYHIFILVGQLISFFPNLIITKYSSTFSLIKDELAALSRSKIGQLDKTDKCLLQSITSIVIRYYKRYTYILPS